MKTIILLAMSFIACGVDNVQVGPKESDGPLVDASQGGGSTDRDEDQGVDEPTHVDTVATTTTTTTTTTTSGGTTGSPIKPKPKVVREYELHHDNPAVSQFISQNYCAGSYLRDCWIRSGVMKEHDDGTYKVSIEFIMSDNEIPYTVESDTITETHAFLLTDKGKAVDDDGFGFRMVWAVVDPVDGTMGVVYDWAGDGPMEQGDDILDVFTFELAGD